MSKYQMVDYIKETPIFNNLGNEDVKCLADNCTVIKYKKGETICKQGGFANHIIFLIDGLAKNYLEGTNDKNLIIELLTPFQLFGLSTLYQEKVYHLSLASITAASVCFIEKAVFVEVIERNNIFAGNVLQEFCMRSTLYYKKIASLGNKQLHGRFADAILYLSKYVAKSNVLELSITRKEIGEMAGISTESAIRLLSELNHDGILTLEGKKIIINKTDLLEKLSEIG